MYSSDEFIDPLLDYRRQPADLASQTQQLCESVLAQTTAVIRKRRRLRRAGTAAALAGCYLAGVATIVLWRSGASIDSSPRGSSLDSAQNLPVATQAAPARKIVRPEDDQMLEDQKQLAAAALTPYERLRRAGDRQLEERGDIPGAMRTYQRALQVASSNQRSLAPDQDTWLLLAVKNSTSEIPHTEQMQ